MTTDKEQLLHEIETLFETVDHVLSAPEYWSSEAHDVHIEYVREARLETLGLLAKLREDLSLPAVQRPEALLHDILE
ncbi:MAG: hypothetical protein K6G61_08095 [Solobacterium sp.]|nr:hypothetical protein [Solobacterium sp.]